MQKQQTDVKVGIQTLEVENQPTKPEKRLQSKVCHARSAKIRICQQLLYVQVSRNYI